MSEFVRASELYDVESGTPIAHPAHQATDDQVRCAVEQLTEPTAHYIREKGGRQLHTTTFVNTRKRVPLRLENGLRTADPVVENGGPE